MSRYIDADKLLSDVEKYRLSDGKFQHWIEVQPTADVRENVHGHWIEDDEGEIYCSECHRYTDDRHDEVKEFEGRTVIALCRPRFCGYCGADMRPKLKGTEYGYTYIDEAPDVRG